MPESLLFVENLTTSFFIKSSKFFSKPKELKAVNDISFYINEGETLGVIGESGCGKTTLGKAVLQLIPSSSGKISYKGQDLTNQSHKSMMAMRKNIQIIFQDPSSSLDPGKTVESIIEEPMIIHRMYPKKKRSKIVLSLLEEVGLSPYHAGRYPYEFSGGQRQRINIARVLALNPEFIVCDEPVSALDVSIQAQVLNLIKRLQKKYNLTLLFISHDLSVVKYVSDRLAIMYLGKIVEIGNTNTIYSNPQHPYTKALFSAIPPESPFERKTKIELKGDLPSPMDLPPGCSLSNRCPYCKDICYVEIPRLKVISEKHKTACHLF